MEQYSDIVRNVLIIHKYFRLYVKDCFREYNINSSEAMVIVMLCSKTESSGRSLFSVIHSFDSGATQEQLVNELHFDKSVMTRTVQSLEAKGYVTRTPNPDDSRSFIILPSKKALELKPQIDQVLHKWDCLMCDNIDDINAVSGALSHMAENIKFKFKGD